MPQKRDHMSKGDLTAKISPLTKTSRVPNSSSPGLGGLCWDGLLTSGVDRPTSCGVSTGLDWQKDSRVSASACLPTLSSPEAPISVPYKLFRL